MTKPSLSHLKKSFFVDRKMPLGEEIGFSRLYTDKPDYTGEFYHVAYGEDGDSPVNEAMYSYYGAKLSRHRETFGGHLPLMNEFITSTILHTISNLRSDPLFVAPRILMQVENDEEFRLFSKMLQSFKKSNSEDLKDSSAGCCYLAGLSIAMQERDPNLANYGTVKDEDGNKIFAKIDSNTYFPALESRRRGSNGGVYFNHMNCGFSEMVDTSPERASFGTLVAKNSVFDHMSSDVDTVRFVGADGCLRIKSGCEENFKHFMMGVKDFIEMPDQFIDFIRVKTSQDLYDKSHSLSEKEQRNIDVSCRQFKDLKVAISQYFEKELELFATMFPEEAAKESIWKGKLERIITPAVSTSSREEEESKKIATDNLKKSASSETVAEL